jgi:hypothetical protein
VRTDWLIKSRRKSQQPQQQLEYLQWKCIKMAAPGQPDDAANGEFAYRIICIAFHCSADHCAVVLVDCYCLSVVLSSFLCTIIIFSFLFYRSLIVVRSFRTSHTHYSFSFLNCFLFLFLNCRYYQLIVVNFEHPRWSFAIAGKLSFYYFVLYY